MAGLSNRLQKFLKISIFLYKLSVMPPRKRYLSTLFLTLFFLCNKVHTYAQTSYKDFKEEQKKIILNEQFISNNNFWPLYDCKIEQGFLISEGIIFGLKTSLSIPIIKNKDYEIEISALGKGEQGSLSSTRTELTPRRRVS